MPCSRRLERNSEPSHSAQPGKWRAGGLVVIEACDLLPPRDQGLAVIEGVVILEMGDEPFGLRPA